MKKATKKIMALLLTVVMVLAMGVCVFADGTVNLKIDNKTNATFTAYKVMNATKSSDGNGNDVYTYTVNDDFKGFFPYTSADEATKYTLSADNEILLNGKAIASDGLHANVNNTETAALASALAKYAREQNISGQNIDPAKGLDTEIGYYVVAETATAATGAVASKPILVDLRKNTEVTPKKSDVDLEKKIVEDGKELDANTANIGDDVEYVVRSSIPTYEANVDSSKLSYVLTDTFTNLTYNRNAVLKVGGKVFEEGTDYTINENDNNFVITLNADAILKNQGENIELTYSAKLNENAAVDSEDGNPNHIKLEYTNNPNVDNSKGTLEDEVNTYTFGLKIHKVDKNDDKKDMAGAAFTVKNSNGEVIGTFEYGEDGKITNPTGLVITTDGNYATIKGLKEGEYTIEETKAPAGYSMLSEPVVIKITDAGKEANGEGKLSIVSGQGTAEVNVENKNGIIDLTVKIENSKGISLPETGSKTAMYCLYGGALLIVLGGLYFGIEKVFSRKRQ